MPLAPLEKNNNPPPRRRRTIFFSTLQSKNKGGDINIAPDGQGGFLIINPPRAEQPQLHSKNKGEISKLEIPPP